MTYKEIASIYQARYARLGYGKQIRKLEYNDALLDISVAQQDLANNYYLAELETSLAITEGTDIYTLPGNILHISLIQFPNGDKCFNASVDKIRVGTKTSGTPEYFMVYGKDNSTLEFNCKPSGITTCTITYCARANMFLGLSDANTGTEYAGLTDSTQILLPSKYSGLIIERALADVFPERLPIFEMQLKRVLSSRNFNMDGKLPDYFDGDEVVRQPGEDTDR